MRQHFSVSRAQPTSRLPAASPSIRSFGAAESKPAPRVFHSVIQRVVLKADNDRYQQLSSSSWYKNLSASEQAVIVKMHSSKKTYTKKQADAEIAKIRGNKKAWKPVGENQYPKTKKKIAEIRKRRYGAADLEPEMVVDSDNEGDPKQAASDYRDRIVARLEETKEAMLGDDASSDSESAAGSDAEAQLLRRRYKATQLAAIARTFHPLEPEEVAFAENLHKKRKVDNDTYVASGGGRQIYSRGTREDYARIGAEMKLTSLEHNPYLRRAFRGANISEQKIREGGKDNYDGAQGKIRDHLRKVLSSDHNVMNWKEEDFQSPEEWRDVQHLLAHGISNDTKRPTYHEQVEKGGDTSNTSTRTAFHHAAWKEADSSFRPHSLNRANLVAMNDQRELLNKAKRKKAIESGTLPVPGAHDTFGHQAQGFLSNEAQEFVRGKRGGQFKAIDYEAVDAVTHSLVNKRVSKKEIYRPS